MVVNKLPLVSIVIPCYNAEKTIHETLNSVLLQTYNNIEIIVVDDGSTDGSLKAIDSFLAGQLKVRIITQHNCGQSKARNNGMYACDGEYVMFLDADDMLAPAYVSECVDVFQSFPETLLVYSDVQLFERETGKLHLDTFILRQFLLRNCIPSFCMLRTEQIKEAGGFDETMRNNEDWECWIRIIARFRGSVVKIPKALYFYRKRLSADSVTDLSNFRNEVDQVFFYIYSKNYSFYQQNNLSISDLVAFAFDRAAWKRRYYNVWYRRIFYMVFKRSKYRALSNKNTLFFE
ncbi:glycosyltransferase family 2 protein [Sphingobacterium paludis]|uniref:Glycosyltransferase involved in cell wall biosynthesis n=1 Tax=Sphingobacterium paludis TaxID=1476465 RepID=A0A4R7CV04_9SPHI|nr:glycosyltransferase [Sphingobacterium paludis]TDS11099.1 glycosyltransferase involved in cell wall biosynthesis [Sphingobacterium paludis]